MKYILCFILFITSGNALCQSVGIGTTAPNSNAVLDIKSANKKGLLIPRGDAATRVSLNSNLAKGLMYYDTTTNSVWIHNGNGLASGWVNQAPNGGSIIPFASGNAFTMTTNASGQSSTVGAITFGNASNVPLSGGIITLTGNYNPAFILSRNGTITAISGYFTNTNAVNLTGTNVSVYAQLYISTTPNDTFFPISPTLQLFPDYTGFIPIGTAIHAGISGIAVPVAAQSRLMLVVSITASGLSPLINITGQFSGSIVIE